MRAIKVIFKHFCFDRTRVFVPLIYNIVQAYGLIAIRLAKSSKRNFSSNIYAISKEWYEPADDWIYNCRATEPNTSS